MSKNYCSYPTEENTTRLRTVFLYAAPEDSEKLPALAERIAHPRVGTKCRVKWLNPAVPIDESDLKTELSLSQVMIVYVTKYLIAQMREMKAENLLPLPIQFMRDNHKPYFPVADFNENIESYCKYDRPVHGLLENDPDFDGKLKEQLSKYILDKETIAEIKEKAIIDQIFLSYRKKDVDDAQNLMREIHNFKGFDAISIWYDRFLTAGNLFDNEILAALEQSNVFAIVMSPNTLAKHPDGTNNYVVEIEYPRAREKNKPIVPIHLPNFAYNQEELKSVFKDIPELLAVEKTEPYFRSVFPDLPTVDTYSSERLYLLGRAYLSGFYFEQDSKRAVSLFQRAAEQTDEFALKSAKMLAELYNSGDLVAGINFDEALKWYLRAAEIAKKIFGKEHKETYVIYNNIGMTYGSKSDYDKALDYYFKVLKITEKTLYNDDPNIASLYNNIGGIYYKKSDYQEALEYCVKALEIFEKVLGKDHPHIATSYNSIGLIYSNKGSYDKALDYFLKAIDINDRAFGKDSRNTVVEYMNIGELYGYIGNYNKALEYYLKAIDICEKVLVKDHPDTATSYNSIGLIYYRCGNCEKALEYYLKALDIQEKVLGKEHPDVACCYDNIGLIYHYKGDLDKTLEYHLRALSVYEKALGKYHQDTAICYNNVGSTYGETGNYDKALEYQFKALETDEKALGKDHPDTAMCYNNIGAIYYGKREYDKALDYYFKSLEIREKILGKDHPDMSMSYNNIGSVYDHTGKYDEALEYHFKALEIREKVLGKDHANTATSYNNIGMAYYCKREFDKALEYSKIALSICTRVLGSGHPTTKIVSGNIRSINEAISKKTSIKISIADKPIDKQKSKPESWLKRLFKKSN